MPFSDTLKQLAPFLGKMHIDSITTYNFRSLNHQTVDLYPQVNFLVGQNGQGKTNFIEAISYLSRGKSFRTARIDDLVQSGQKEASVFAKISQDDLQIVLGISIKEDGKDYFYNHDKLPSLKEFLGHIICVSFTPNDLNLIKGGPIERRSFLDKHIIDVMPSYLDAFLNYQRALRNKSHLLKKGTATENMLAPWNKILSQEAVKILKSRYDFVENLSPKINYFYQRFSNDQSNVTLKLKSNLASHKEEITVEAFEGIYEKNMRREIAMQSTIIGPQRDDLEVNLNNTNSRVFSSQGESRSLVLALKLAAIELIEERRKISPIVLLDDVDSELDNSRREALLELVFAKDRQSIITGTQVRMADLERFKTYAIFEVSKGNIKPKSA